MQTTGRMEQNAAIGFIKSHAPDWMEVQKVGVNREAGICILTVPFPDVVKTRPEARAFAEEMQQATGWTITWNDAANQGRLAELALSLCREAGIDVAQNPSTYPGKVVRVRLFSGVALPEDVARQFRERTGWTLERLDEKTETVDLSSDRMEINQALAKIEASAKERGVTVIGLELPGYVAKMCEENKIPFLYLGRSVGFNPLTGSAEEAAELAAFVVDQSPHFLPSVQRVAIRNTVLLLKRINPNTTLFDVLNLFQNLDQVKPILHQYKERYGNDDLAGYFEDEVTSDRFAQFVVGLRIKLEDFLGERHAQQVLRQQEYVDFDKLLADGGVLLVEDEWGLVRTTELKNNLILQALLNAVWRRKPNGRPHYVLVDTESPYRLDHVALQMGRPHRCGFFFTAQTLRGNKKDLAMMCKNKVVFHAMPEDAEFLAKELGTTTEEFWELPYFQFKANIGQGTPAR